MLCKGMKKLFVIIIRLLWGKAKYMTRLRKSSLAINSRGLQGAVQKHVSLLHMSCNITSAVQ